MVLTGALVLELLVAFFGSATATVSFLPNSVDQPVYPGDHVQYVCFVSTTAGMSWSVFSDQRFFPGASSVGDLINIDSTYFIVLTNTTGGFTSTLSFVSTNDQDRLNISCQNLGDQTIVATQFFIISAPPSPESVSVVYSDPTTVTVTWNQLSSEYKITEYRVNVMINGLLDTRTVTEPSITIMDVGVDDTLNITVAAVDIIDRGGTFSDTLELNYTKDRPPQLQMPTINYLSPNELFIDWDELSLSEYQISHYMVNVTINSSSEIIVANVASTNINVTPGDSVSVLVAAVDEAGRQGEFSDDSQFDNTSPVAPNFDVYYHTREKKIVPMNIFIEVLNASTNRPPINYYVLNGSIDGVPVNYNHLELFYNFTVDRTDKIQVLSLDVEAVNDIGKTSTQMIIEIPAEEIDIFLILFLVTLGLLLLMCVAILIALACLCWLKQKQRVSDDKAGNSIPLEVVDSTMDVKPIYK